MVAGSYKHAIGKLYLIGRYVYIVTVHVYPVFTESALDVQMLFSYYGSTILSSFYVLFFLCHFRTEIISRNKCSWREALTMYAKWY